jgi:SAM-dependent methyltransferase
MQPFGTYTGVDLSDAMLDRARRKMAERDDAHFIQLDLETDPLPDGPFDLIVSTWALEHLQDPGAVVEKAWEHLRPGGYMLLFFEIATPYWWGQLVGRVLRFFSAEKVPEPVYLDFPGLIAVNRYRGAFGDVALVTLRKPREDAL